MHTCQNCNNCFTRKNNLSRHGKEACKGVRQPTSSGSLKRQKIEPVPERLETSQRLVKEESNEESKRSQRGVK